VGFRGLGTGTGITMVRWGTMGIGGGENEFAVAVSKPVLVVPKACASAGPQAFG
jgi:hypothetical protein